MQRLVNIANVVNDQTQSKRSRISFIWETLLDLFVVVAGFVLGTNTSQPLIQACQCVQHIIFTLNKAEITERATFVEVGLINEMPIVLPAVIAFHIVSKRRRFREWVLVLFARNGRVVLLKNCHFSKSLL